MGVTRRIPLLIGVFLLVGIVWGAQQVAPTRVGTAGQQSSSNPAQQQSRARISGVVTNGASGQPLRKAQVTLISGSAGQGNNRGQANPQRGQQPEPGQAARGQQTQNGPNGERGGGSRSVTTGEDGAFVFDDVVPGTYRIRVDRDGFLSQEYGQRSWTGSGVPLTLQAGQTLSSVTFALIQGGTLVGRIVDENLEPVTGIQVQSLTYVYQNGTRTLVSERQVETNDLGEYRLYWLTPGEHYVSAIPEARRGGLVQALQGAFQRGGRGGPSPVSSQPAETYAATFYPGTIDPETAVPVRVAAASEVRGIDFVLRPTPTVKISGRVVGVDIAPTAQQLQQQAQQQQQGRGGRGGRGARGGFAGNMQILLTRIGASATGGRGGGGRGGRGGGLNSIEFLSPVNPDGTFEIANVIPGAYNLLAIQQAQNQTYSTRTRIDVGRNDIGGINLAVRPGVDIPGQISIEGTAPASFRMNGLRVNLTPQDNLPIGNTSAQVDESGKFTLASVPTMSYRINIQGLPASGYLIAGKLGGSDALGESLQIEQSAALSLQVGFTPGQISVAVTDNVGQPFPGAITVLIPSTRSRSDLYKTATSDPSGQVTFTGVAPGDYKILAWEDVPQGAYLNADFLAPFEDRGQAIHVDRGGVVSAQLKVIVRGDQ